MKCLPFMAALAGTLLPAALRAAPFRPPIPQSQTHAAYVSFAVASVVLVIMLGVVQWLVSRR